MKVLMITTSYPDHPGSQRGIFIRKLCLHLKNSGLDVAVLTPKILAGSPFFEDDMGIAVHRFWFPSGNRPLNQRENIPVISMTVYMVSGLIKAFRLISSYKPDVIHGNWIVPTGLIAAIAGCICRIPVLNTARGMDMRISERQPIRALFNLAVRLSDKVTVVSPSMRIRKVLELAEITPTGVDESFFDLHPDRGKKTVIYTRSLEPVYDVETLIRSIPFVLEKVPDVQFLIAGTGSQETHIKNLARELGVENHTTFLGFVPSEQILLLMEKASVFVSPAVADGTSIALLEAIASGLTPVVSDIEANRSLVIDSRDGFLFSPKDHEELALKITRAFSGEISIKVLEQKRKEFRDQIAWSSVVGRFISSYAQIAVRRVHE
jgi:glycosyltransferase involved in cell wall biosynthesis